jgi:hypothetical protein
MNEIIINCLLSNCIEAKTEILRTAEVLLIIILFYAVFTNTAVLYMKSSVAYLAVRLLFGALRWSVLIMLSFAVPHIGARHFAL